MIAMGSKQYLLKGIFSMINSKSVRILCYIAVGISFVFTLVLSIFAGKEMAEGRVIKGIFILLVGLIIPLVTALSLYPIYALSLIESHTSELNANVNLLLEQVKPSNKEVPCTPSATTPSNTIPSSSQVSLPQKDLIDFINHKYDTQIGVDDALDVIKDKILNIEYNTNSVQIFKKRISSANSIDEIIAIMKLHRASTNFPMFK